MIEASGLGKVYANGTVALKDLDLHVDRAEVLFIRGQSGAGKTTLFKLIMGMEDPSIGVLNVNGCRIGQCNSRSLRNLRRKMGVVFQDFRLIKGRSARENVELGMRVLGVSGAEVRRRAAEYLDRLGLEDRSESRVEALSWGEQQRLVVARALAREPEIILADEPTGNLDEELSLRVMDLLLGAHARGATVLVATHSPDILRQTTNRVITLRRGSLVADTAVHPGGGGLQ
ncbi:MAG: ABC transporter ATP-binding protein [Bacillota bacterium]